MASEVCLDVLAPSITEMVNLSLLSGNWTTAIVIPLLKKKTCMDLIWSTKISVQSVIFHSFLR